MKHIAITTAILLSACVSYDAELEAHLQAEYDFHSHQSYVQNLYETHDPEYLDDCMYYYGMLEC
jgi:hypothetical protein